MKLAFAHGCYWHRCAFLRQHRSTTSRASTPRTPTRSSGGSEEVQRRTGEAVFNFVDEAVPPALLRGVAERLLARRVRVEWWANIRFERAFTPALARTLARAGCVAVTGGLECAEDRLLGVMGKGVRLPEAARAATRSRRPESSCTRISCTVFRGRRYRRRSTRWRSCGSFSAAGCLHSAYCTGSL